MKIYHVHPAADNPLFEGLSVETNRELLDTLPLDWKKNWQSWEPIRRAEGWVPPLCGGNVRTFNDFPSFTHHFYSQRAVDLIGDLLAPNGELLPVNHRLGTYYFFNCTTIVNAADLDKSPLLRHRHGIHDPVDHVQFLDAVTHGLTIFRTRTLPTTQLCTQTFVDRVLAHGLQGFVFILIAPYGPGQSYGLEYSVAVNAASRWKPGERPALDIKGNTVVLRLYCDRKTPTKKDAAAAKAVMDRLEKELYDPEGEADAYCGNVEGHDTVDSEIRIFLSAPDCDRIVTRLMPAFRTLPWPGKFHVVKRRGEFVYVSAAEEYVRIA